MKKITLLFFICTISSLNAQTVLFSDDFEAETPESTTYTNWTAVDVDGDTEFFEVSDISGSAIEASPLQGLVADSDSWESGNPNSPMNPDNYLITTNPIDLTGATDGMLSFTIGTYQTNGTFTGDRLAVYISTSNDPVVISGETPIFDDTVGNTTPADNGGTNSGTDLNLDISSFEGQTVYIVFRHYNTFDENSVLIDNVEVSSAALSLDEFELNRITHRFDQTSKVLTLDSQSVLQQMRVYNVLGQEVMRVSLNNTHTEVDLSRLQSGMYIVKISGVDNASKTIKLVVK